MSIENTKRKLDKIFLTEPAPENDYEIVKTEPTNIETVEKPVLNLMPDLAIEDDFDFAQRNLRNAINVGSEAAKECLELAKLNESGKMFEGFSAILKTVSENTNRLLQLHQQKKDFLKKEKSQEDSKKENTVINNNVMIATTDQLQRKLLEENK